MIKSYVKKLKKWSPSRTSTFCSNLCHKISRKPIALYMKKLAIFLAFYPFLSLMATSSTELQKKRVTWPTHSKWQTENLLKNVEKFSIFPWSVIHFSFFETCTWKSHMKTTQNEKWEKKYFPSQYIRIFLDPIDDGGRIQLVSRLQCQSYETRKLINENQARAHFSSNNVNNIYSRLPRTFNSTTFWFSTNS